MKKFIAILISVLLLCGMTTAMAADEKVTVAIQPVDYQTGKAVSKTYVENELFKLRVDLNVPRFADIENLELIIECDGVEIEEPVMTLTTGRYYLEGIVLTQPAAICVKIKDVALDNAETAEEMYEAMQKDRTVTKCYYFNSAQPAVNNNLYIPKTGDYTVTGFIILGLAALAAVMLFQTVKRAKR